MLRTPACHEQYVHTVCRLPPVPCALWFCSVAPGQLFPAMFRTILAKTTMSCPLEGVEVRYVEHTYLLFRKSDKPPLAIKLKAAPSDGPLSCAALTPHEQAMTQITEGRLRVYDSGALLTL